MAGWIKKVVKRKNYIETVQFYAKLSTNGLIFRTYSTYTERRSAFESCIIDNTHCIVFSF